MKPYFQDEFCTIYHGDCREMLSGLAYDATLSDPPYGILANGGSAATIRSGFLGSISWDIQPSSETLNLLLSRPTMLWGGCHLPLPPTFGYLVWDKQIDGLNFGEVEFCWTNLRFAPRVFRYRAVGIDGGKQHPTQKPEALMSWCFRFFPPGVLTVLDPFMGSGTTLRAAKDLGRKAIGIEIEERYCEIAANRLRQAVLSFDMPIGPSADPVNRSLLDDGGGEPGCL